MLWRSTFTSPVTLTLDVQGQILKKLYFKNGKVDWHRTKGMWVDRMLIHVVAFNIPEIKHSQNLTLQIQGQGQMTMMLHNYRSGHRTSNGINLSSGLRDMGCAPVPFPPDVACCVVTIIMRSLAYVLGWRGCEHQRAPSSAGTRLVWYRRLLNEGPVLTGHQTPGCAFIKGCYLIHLGSSYAWSHFSFYQTGSAPYLILHADPNGISAEPPPRVG